MTETIGSAKALCKVFMRAGIPVFMEGPPGVGKSDAWQQIANEEKIKLIDVRLAQMDPVDLRGLPKVKGDLSTWARPDFWPTVERDGERGIILFDEAADCSKAMQSAMYQIVLNGRAGPHVIPPGWYRCAAGNNQKHRAGAQAISTALASRFAWLEVEPSPEEFYSYGLQQGYHEYVLGFIKFRPTLIHSMFDATDTEKKGKDNKVVATARAAEKAFPCSRTWEMVSRICKLHTDQITLTKSTIACVGEGAGIEFSNFIKTLDLPSLEDVLKAPKTCPIPKQPSSRYALVAMLARGATRDNLGKILQYASRPDFGREFEICLTLDGCKRDASLTETKAFCDFANRNSDLQL